MTFVYVCFECGEEYHHKDNGTHYCNWFDCENDEPLELIEVKEGIA